MGRTTRFVRTSESGFSLFDGDSELYAVRWSDLEEIFAFKVDVFAHDVIYLGFREARTDEYKEVEEECHGWNALVAEVEKRYAIDPGWWSQVAFPPFETNLTTLWQRMKKSPPPTRGDGD